MNEIQKDRGHRFAQLVGLELKANFTRHEVSQTSVADRLGHSRTSFSKWLNAKPSMPMEALINTCELIGVDPRSVFNAAYSRLIEEMGEANAEKHEDIDIDAWANRIKAEDGATVQRAHIAQRGGNRL